MLKNQIISVIGLGKMGLGIYNRLYNKNFNIYGYDINPDIKINNTHINFLELEKIFELSHLILLVVPSNEEIFSIIKKYKIKMNSILLDLTTSIPDQTIKINNYLSKKESN